uniref:DUF659 domain-containing protein n=1 Tax=Vitis vinifera TaxID=29760 RepID=A5CBV8_VITVI|nr:hypothetical protein VITISV_030929 [Vitis vinifera]
MNMGSEDVNEDLFGLEDEDFCEEINSRMNVTNISSGEMVVQNRRSRKMYQTTTNDAYKKEARERACMFITRWMYEAVIPFNAVTYPSFQPMIEAIGQYGVGMKGPTFHEVSSPLVRVLRLVDGEKKTLMRYIYEDLNRAKDTIVRSFNRNEEKYKEIFNIIDKRWEIQLHRPLHAAGAIGAEEAKFDTRARARARSSIIPLMRGIASSSRTLPFHSLIDEDEDRDMVDSTDEEYGEGYKCGDGNDDDGDFVDLEEE